MAGDWIKMRTNLWDDPRVTRLCDDTAQAEGMIIGALYWLWSTADQHTENGFMPGLTLHSIDRKTCINGFGLALCKIGWLIDQADGVLLVNFGDHNGSSAKKRCQTAKRVGNHRATNASKTPNQSNCNALSVMDTLPKEEEDKSITTTSSSKKFLICDDWQPSENFPARLALAGINPEIHLTASSHTEFITFWASRDNPLLLTQAQWDHKFLKAIQSNHQRSRTGGSHANGISNPRKLTPHERLVAANATAAGQ
jgi:hypothetical protein